MSLIIFSTRYFIPYDFNKYLLMIEYSDYLITSYMNYILEDFGNKNTVNTEYNIIILWWL